MATAVKKPAAKKTAAPKKEPVKKTGRDLIVVESPNKVRSISNIVGNKYNVMASRGHVMRIADKGYKNLGIDVQDGTFKISYSKIKTSSDILRNLKISAQEANTVYLASDLDREGELISANLREALKLKKGDYKRIVFNEITEKAILEALENPRDIDEKMVDAAETRGIEDKIIGYMLSGLARKAVGAQSVGRVQSAALIIVCEREQEINDFIPKTYYEIYIQINKDNKNYLAKYVGTTKGENKDLSELELVNTILERCRLHSEYTVKEIKKSPRKTNPPKPLITTSMQTEASSKLGFSPNETMSLAQGLFEGPNVEGINHGLITYLRTDKAEYSEDFTREAESYIINNFGREYLGKQEPKKAKPKKEGEEEIKTQEAHEGIRPTDLSISPDFLKGKVPDKMYRLYKMIFERSIASYMPPKEMSVTNVIINNLDDLFNYRYTDVTFDGFSKVYEDATEDDNEDETNSGKLDLNVGDRADVKSIYAVEKETVPPRRYSEAGLIKKMESSGIGRPSTYASTMKTLKDREYVEINQRSIQPTILGMKLWKFIQEHFNSVINVEYTSHMEKDLDLILEGKADKLEILTEFYKGITDTISKFNVFWSKNKPEDEPVEGRVCPDCGEQLVYKTSGKGTRYITCVNKPSCKYVEWIKNEDKSVKCPTCEPGYIVPKPYKDKKSGKSKFLYGCNDYPTCKHIMDEELYNKIKNGEKAE